VLALLLVASAGAPVGAATARTIPSPTGGRLFSCPDPSVAAVHLGRYRYYLACTSDSAPNAFPTYGSNDLVHWRHIGYVFPKRHQPWWALHSPVGRYWAPAIYRIRGRWVLYFAAEYNRRVLHRRLPGRMVIGVATAASIHGPWHSKLLHYRGQFNSRGGEQETYGGVIDPSMVQDPATGQRYLFWAEQHSSIWDAELSADGRRIVSDPHQALWVDRGWACAPTCVAEGPEEFFRNGWLYLLYSGGSTWSGTYAVGAAVARDPVHSVFRPLGGEPILRSGHGWLGPGGCSHPIVGPNGRTYLFYHAERSPNPDRISAKRYLLVSPVSFARLDGFGPLVNRGLAG
jgi:arabinan endo-1,5-alpha-L-arabinosidase